MNGIQKIKGNIYIYIEREREGEKRTNKTNANKQLLVSRLHIYQVSFNIPLLQIYYRQLFCLISSYD